MPIPFVLAGLTLTGLFGAGAAAATTAAGFATGAAATAGTVAATAAGATALGAGTAAGISTTGLPAIAGVAATLAVPTAGAIASTAKTFITFIIGGITFVIGTAPIIYEVGKENGETIGIEKGSELASKEFCDKIEQLLVCSTKNINAIKNSEVRDLLDKCDFILSSYEGNRTFDDLSAEEKKNFFEITNRACKLRLALQEKELA